MKILNIFLIVLGISLICSNFFFTASDCFQQKIIDLLVNLGIGLFPTGAIGLIIEFVQDKHQSEIKKYKRQSILKDFQYTIQNYLNVLCDKYFQLKEANNQKIERKIKVSDIFTVIKDFECDFVKDCNNNQATCDMTIVTGLFLKEGEVINTLIPFIQRIIDEQNMYISNEIFSQSELDLLNGLKDHAEKYHDKIMQNNLIGSLQDKTALLSQIENVLNEVHELYLLKGGVYLQYRIV